MGHGAARLIGVRGLMFHIVVPTFGQKHTYLSRLFFGRIGVSSKQFLGPHALSGIG